MAVAVAVGVSGGGAVALALALALTLALAVAGLTKRSFNHPERFVNQCLGLVVISTVTL